MIGSATSAATGAGVADSTAAMSSAIPGGAMGKDQFLKMLIAQLRNQDPLSPLQGDQMASELAQFSSLEQLQQINAALSGQDASNGAVLGAIQASAAINTIGHTVIAAGNAIEIGGDHGATSVLAATAGPGTGTLHIYNTAGVEVGSRSLGHITGGRQEFDLGDAVKGLPDGTYTYAIDVTDADGNAVDVQTYVRAVVDGVSSSPDGILLTAGGLAIPYASVLQILQ